MNLDKKRMETLKWEIRKVENFLVDGRVIYAHRQAKSIIPVFQSELTAISRMGQFARMVSRMRNGEIIDAHNDAKSIFDFINGLLSKTSMEM